MDDAQDTQQAASEAEGVAAEGVDPGPRPTFEGDWNSATGVEKGRHSERVRQWKAAVDAAAERDARRRMAAGSQQPVPGLGPDGDAQRPTPDATRAVLEAIRDNSQAHDSDRIRAAQQLIALDRGERAEGVGESDLVTLRATLELLPPHERLAWLQGERLEALRA